MRKPLRTLMLNCSIALMAFAIGCLANYFWLFNYGEPLPVPSDVWGIQATKGSQRIARIS
jgi:hypothetical protein